MGTSDKSMQRLKKSSQHLRRNRAKSLLTLHQTEAVPKDSGMLSVLARLSRSEPDVSVVR